MASFWRPQTLDQYIGQHGLIDVLKDEVVASIQLNRPLPNMTFHGKPGLGKTTLIDVLARQRGVEFRKIMGESANNTTLGKEFAAFSGSGYDSRGVIINREAIKPGILAIDEAEKMKTAVFESLHTVMEPDAQGRRIYHFKLNSTSPSREMWVPEITIIFLTNYFGEMKKKAAAAMNRCGIIWGFEDYTTDELMVIISQFAVRNNVNIDTDACHELAMRSMGIPRSALNMFDRVRARFEAAKHSGEQIDTITRQIVLDALDKHRIDKEGLNDNARKYLKALSVNPNGKMGLETIAAVTGIDPKTIQFEIEPALLQKGMVSIQSGGRQITQTGIEHIGDGVVNPILSRLLPS